MKNYITNDTCRFAEPDELKAAGTRIDCRARQTEVGGPVLYSDGTSAYVCGEDCHSIAFGSTGSKKTRLYISPLIVSLAKAEESMVINDPKGELFRRFSGLLKESGYDVVVLNYRDPERGSRWSPFKVPGELYLEGDEEKSDTYLHDIAETLYGELRENTTDAYWPSAAQDYFTGVAQCVRKETNGRGLSMENIRICSVEGMEGREYRKIFSEYLNHQDKKSSMSMNLRETVNLTDSTLSCILSFFSAPLNIYCSEGIRDMMADSDFDMRDIGRRKTAVFLITPAERASFNPMITSFVKQSYSVLIDLVASRQPDGMLPVRVNYVLDEFSNLPVIPDFNNMISMARGSNIRFHLVVQSVDQLYSHYSDHEAVNIMNNCDLWYILRNKDTRLHRIITELCGNRVSTYQRIQTPLVTPMTIQKLDKKRGEMLVFYSGLDPYIGCYPDIDEYDFCLPSAAEVRPAPRKPVKREIFSLKELVEKYREEENKKRDRSLRGMLGESNPFG